MASRYVQIRQRHVLEKLHQINVQMKINEAKRVKKHAKQRNLVWLEYMNINAKVLRICKQIRAYSGYWSFHLTCIFPYYIILQVF